MVAREMVVVAVSGLILYWLLPLLNTFRTSILETGGYGLVMTFILMNYIPIIWIIYGFSSLMYLKKGIEGRDNAE